jgi:beta-mannosidase
VVDYYIAKKLAYYYLRRVQRPVCIMVDELKDWRAQVVVGNDSLRDVSGTFRIWDADGGDTLLEGPFRVPANENVELGSCKLYHSDQRLLLIEWVVGGERRGNHRLTGSPPFSAPRYRDWLARIAALPDGFAADDVAR